MKLIAFCASALMMLSGLAHAGGAPAPGPASAVSTLTPLPSVTRAVHSGPNRQIIRTERGSSLATLVRPMSIPRPPRPTLNVIRSFASAQPTADGGVMVRSVTLTTAQGPLSVHVSLDGSGRITLLPVDPSEEQPTFSR